MQQLVNLLGLQLKSDPIIEMLELYDIDVVYSFDRLHENTDDEYWASVKPIGCQLHFNAAQTLQTIFCHIVGDGDFEAINVDMIGVPVLRTVSEAEAHASRGGLPFESGSTTSILTGSPIRWLRMQHAHGTTHYEYRPERLEVITIALAP